MGTRTNIEAKTFYSIKWKIFFLFLAVLIVPTVTISLTSYFVSLNNSKKLLAHSITDNLAYIGNTIKKSLDEWETTSEFVYVNPVIKSALSQHFETNLSFYTEMKKVDTVLNEYALQSPQFAFISSMVIMGYNDRNLIYGEDANRVDIEELKGKSWYNKVGPLNGEALWLGIHPNYSSVRYRNPYVVSFAREIRGGTPFRPLGVLYMGFNTSLFPKLLQNTSSRSSDSLILLDDKDNIVYCSDAKLVGQPLRETPLYIGPMPGSSYQIVDMDGSKNMVAYHTIDKYGWKVVEIVPFQELVKESELILKVTVASFVLSFLVAAGLWFFVSSRIVRPVRRLAHTMKQVSNKNILLKTDVRTNDEFGILGENYNYMIDRIHLLIDNVLQEQAEKKGAEYRALQAQINPHFLYNTLNTIRWMAIIQKADNIQVVVDALARLLRNTFRHETMTITLGEELQLLSDYILIQQFRYKDKFEVILDVPEELKGAACIKFLLQPIVENAIFHGIEPKEGTGVIRISAARDGSRMTLRIEDDGIGIPPEKMEALSRLLESDPRGLRTRGVGLLNTHLRIGMAYGHPYGLSISREEGGYTVITIVFPYSELKMDDGTGEGGSF